MTTTQAETDTIIIFLDFPEEESSGSSSELCVSVGKNVGSKDGTKEGSDVGIEVGTCVGFDVGNGVCFGVCDGVCFGVSDGVCFGVGDGVFDGVGLGVSDGVCLGVGDWVAGCKWRIKYKPAQTGLFPVPEIDWEVTVTNSSWILLHSIGDGKTNWIRVEG